MPVIRNSGSRKVSPTSGLITGTSGIATVGQQGNAVNLNGYLNLVKDQSTTTYVTIKNNNNNVGNVSNPLGQDSPAPIDQTLYSTTEQRKRAEAYFSGGVEIGRAHV